MFPLDPKTVDRLAKLIVDIDGPYERRGRELEDLLRHAGWADPPEYDGSPRVPWLAEQLEERRDEWIAVERLLCRICDPVEYEQGMTVADALRVSVNRILEPERLVISFISSRPVLGELDSAGTATFTEPDDLLARLTALISDQRAVELLMSRIAETRICEVNGAYTMAIIGIGSFVEGLLYSLLTERDERIRKHGFPGYNGKSIPAERAGLQMLIDVAHEKQWIQLDAKDFMHNVRQYRNFVHPRAELEKQPRFDGDSVKLCWAPVHAVLNDLEERLA